MQCINDQTKGTDVNYIIGDLFEITCASPQQENVCKKNINPKEIEYFVNFIDVYLSLNI